MKYLFGYKPGRVISEQDFDYTTDDYLDSSEMGEERKPERLVKHIDTGKLVGTHKHKKGFHPNRHGEELGFEHHPIHIPYGTKFGATEVGDFDYEEGDFNEEEEDNLFEQEEPFRDNSGLDEYNFPDELKDRLSNIYLLLDEVMDNPEYNPSDYSDMYDFAEDVIGGVLFRLFKEFGDEFEEYEDDVQDYLKQNEDEYIFDYYISNSDFDDDDEDTLFEQEEPKTDRYMFFSNLEQIHRQMGILLEKDPEMISDILENGHDWAQDHIATAKESIDQVFDFIMNEEKGDDDEDF